MATQKPHEMRLSGPALKVLKLFIVEPLQSRSGAELSRRAVIGSGTLYPLLARFEEAGWLKSEWEQIDPADVGRPRRRLYRLTALGQRNASLAFAELQVPREVLIWTS